MSKISSVLGVIEKIESVDITVHQERCVAVRNRNSSCRRCAQACTSEAISYKEDELVIAPEVCIGCGTCATVCPTCALEARNPNDAELFTRGLTAIDATGGTPVIACSSYLAAYQGIYDREAVVEVGCLGRVEETFLTGLIANDAKGILLVDGSCATCLHRTGYDVAHCVCDTTEALLDACGFHEAHIEFIAELPYEVLLEHSDDVRAQGVSRREFLAQMKEGAGKAAFVAAAGVADDVTGMAQRDQARENPRYMHVMADGTLPHFVPSRRERLLDWLSLLGCPEGETIATRLWGRAEVNEDLCTSCRMCATFCPTGAIVKFDDEDGTFGIEHYPSDCVHCGLCMDVCPHGAIALTDEVPVVALTEGLSWRCEMVPIASPPNQPKSIYNKMYSMLGGGQIYER